MIGFLKCSTLLNLRENHSGNEPHNQLEIQLKNYKDFMPLCPADSLPKLVNEMMKIHCRLEKIREFTLEELVEKVDYQYENKQSKTNFKTI